MAEHVALGGQRTGGETPRPCLSAFKFNRATGFAYFAPITAVGRAFHSTGVAVNLSGAGTETTGVVQVDQVRSFDYRERGGTFKEKLGPEIVGQVLERFAPIFGFGLL